MGDRTEEVMSQDEGGWGVEILCSKNDVNSFCRDIPQISGFHGLISGEQSGFVEKVPVPFSTMGAPLNITLTVQQTVFVIIV